MVRDGCVCGRIGGVVWVVIADPEHLATDLDEAQGVRWTPDRIEVAVRFDGSRLIIRRQGG